MNDFFDVCILGAGSAGMAAAYALANERKHRVIIVEKFSSLGGTAVNAWVNTWAESLNPPYLKSIYEELKVQGKVTGELDLSWVPARFAKSGQSDQLVFDIQALAQKYRADMQKARVTVLTECAFVRVAERDRERITGIEIQDKTGKKQLIRARYFIDSSGDGVLCRCANPVEGEDFFYGEDGKRRFGESLAPERPDKKMMNEPSLFFKVAEKYDDSRVLEKVKTVKRVGKEIQKPVYVNADGYYGGEWVNPLTGMGMNGSDLIPLEENYEKCYRELRGKRQYEYWKYIKLNAQKAFEETGNEHHQWADGWEAGIRHYGHTGECAPALGIRESYRIHCEYMLRQSDLTKRIDPDRLGDYIACGSHGIDLHVYGNINSQQVVDFNARELQPSGIPYRCLIPKKLANVLIACRAYGASHIALAARRLNKDIAQLGWAAGHAVRICLEEELKDVREVNVRKLQQPEYTAFRESVKYLVTLLK